MICDDSCACSSPEQRSAPAVSFDVFVRSMTLHVLVINLERSADRRAAITSRLAVHGLVPEFFAATDGRLLDPARLAQLAGPQGLSPGEIGTYLSHVGAWRRIVDRGWDAALILEDDAVFTAELPAVLASLTPVVLARFDVVRLASLMKQVGKPLDALTGQHTLVLPTKNPSGLQGYVVTARGARRLLEEMGTPRVAIDTAMDRVWQRHVDVVLVVPPVVYEDSSLPSLTTSTGRSVVRRPTRRVAVWANSLHKHWNLSRVHARLSGRGWLSYWITPTVSQPVKRPSVS
jgi:glycosyl transferase family 25